MIRKDSRLSKRKFIIYTVLGVVVAAMLTIICIIGYELVNQSSNRERVSDVKAPTTRETESIPLQDKPDDKVIVAGETSPPNDPVEWTWLKKAEPWQGDLDKSFVATSRPVTWEEIIDFVQKQTVGEYKDGIRLGVFFDEDFGRKMLTAGKTGANLLYDSDDSPLTRAPNLGIERSPAKVRLAKWTSKERIYSRAVWNASFESGHLTCSTTEYNVILDKTGQRAVKSVPEIWWLIYVNIFDVGYPPYLTTYFYDLDELEVLVFDRKGGKQIATFTAPRIAIDVALVQGPYPKDALDASFNEDVKINQLYNAGAISKKEHSQLQHEWAIKELGYFRDWFILMAKYGAQLEVNDNIAHEVPFDFLPK